MSAKQADREPAKLADRLTVDHWEKELARSPCRLDEPMEAMLMAVLNHELTEITQEDPRGRPRFECGRHTVKTILPYLLHVLACATDAKMTVTWREVMQCVVMSLARERVARVTPPKEGGSKP